MKHLWAVLRKLSLGDILQMDFFLAAGGAVGALVLALNAPENLLSAVGVASEIVGVTIGAMIAGVAITAAFLDQSFLRKLKAIDRDPVDYLSPFLFTVAAGVAALLSLMVLSTVTTGAPTWLLASVGTLAGFFSTWSIASLIPVMGTLVQFVQLRMAAVDVPDDVQSLEQRRAGRN